jgi:gamma-glutamyltranspeptidase/glutathione hydrolase
LAAEVAPAPGRRYRGFTVHAPPAWSQGPALLQVLGILEGFSIASLPHSSADHIHLLVEALKLACSDRERFYGDPSFVRVPMDDLLSDERAAELRGRITMDAVLPDLPTIAHAGQGTSHLAVVDAAGNALSVAPSDPLASGPLVPGLGFLASTRGVQSRLDPNHPASLEPGKRPRVTPAPALALDDDGSPWPIAGAGGDMILQATLQAFSNVLDFGMTMQQAAEAPRICSLAFPISFHPHPHVQGQLCLEARIDGGVIRELADRGHRVQEWPEYEFDAGSVGMVRRLSNGTLVAGADPRRAAYGAGR